MLVTHLASLTRQELLLSITSIRNLLPTHIRLGGALSTLASAYRYALPSLSSLYRTFLTLLEYIEKLNELLT